MQKIIQIYPCLLKLSRKQESVTDGQTDSRYYYIPHCYRGGDKNIDSQMKTDNETKVSKKFLNLAKLNEYMYTGDLSLYIFWYVAE